MLPLWAAWRNLRKKKWSHSESKHHINYLEMLAILLGL